MRRTNVRRLLVVSAAMLYPDVGLAGSIVRFILRRRAGDLATMEKVLGRATSNGRSCGRRASRMPSHWPLPPIGAPPASERPDFARPLQHAILDVVEERGYVRKVMGVSR